MEKFLKTKFASSAFNICETQPISKMEVTQEMHINLKDNYVPTKHTKAAPIPMFLYKPTKEDIERDVRLGVLEVAPHDESTEWVCQMLAVPKKGDGAGVRRVINYKPLNKWGKRMPHVTMDPFKQVTAVPTPGEGEEMLFTTTDAWNGYHSIPLDEESRPLTTFITEWGCYRYKVAPQGYLGSGDKYTFEYDQIQKGMESKFQRLFQNQ